MSDPSPDAPSDFIRDIIAADLRKGRHQTVVTRFPPEPNGYLHIGHSKSICLNFGLAEQFGGRCHLRFDDSNPTTEDMEYVEAIQRDIRWLGFDWGEHLHFASDYFEQLYDFAVELIGRGKAYVCSLSEAEIREYRGTVTTPGRPSPGRERSVDENLELFADMRAGEFKDGEHVLRARIDMTSPNMKMRDPLLYRIRHAHHYRTGDKWCIYPLYDFTHCLSDSIEGMTHSICTLEFENNRELYDWILDNLDVPQPRPHQYEFARLNLNYTVMSKRRFLELVNGDYVSGWDDPRMPTLAGIRRRGVTPEAMRALRDTGGRVQEQQHGRSGAVRAHAARGSERGLAARHGRAEAAQSRDRELPGGADRGARRAVLAARHPQAGLAQAALRRASSTSKRTTSWRSRRRNGSGWLRGARCGCATHTSSSASAW